MGKAPLSCLVLVALLAIVGCEQAEQDRVTTPADAGPGEVVEPGGSTVQPQADVGNIPTLPVPEIPTPMPPTPGGPDGPDEPEDPPPNDPQPPSPGDEEEGGQAEFCPGDCAQGFVKCYASCDHICTTDAGKSGCRQHCLDCASQGPAPEPERVPE